MNYLTFEKAFRDFSIISVRDIQKRFSNFDSRRLVEWQQKGYILKIRRGYYCFGPYPKEEHFLYFTANKIYAPSYVSFESALAYYNLIPEGVFITTSATTCNTASYDTPLGHFDYKHLKPLLYFGYTLIKTHRFTVKMAEPEKAILDYFYRNKVNSMEDMEEMRFNGIQAMEILDLVKLEKYQKIFNSNILHQRIQMFQKLIHA